MVSCGAMWVPGHMREALLQEDGGLSAPRMGGEAPRDGQGVIPGRGKDPRMCGAHAAPSDMQAPRLIPG